MNIIPHSPNIQYSSVTPSTDALRQQNQTRQTIPQTTEVKPYPQEKPISDSDRFRNVPNDSQPNAEEIQQQAIEQQTTINERDGEQQGQQQGQSGSERQSDDSEERSAQRDGQQPTPEEIQELKIISELAARDKEVRIHEQTHDRVGGPYTGSPSYSYEKGPDGKNYAVSGSVSVDLSTVPGDPKATIAKMQRIRQAALAPASPSAQDQKVAATAQRIIAQQQMQVLNEGDELRINEPVLSGSAQEFKGIEDTVFSSDEESISDVNIRAIRINNFYQDATQPQSISQAYVV